VLRALQARGLIQPAGYQRERRALARQRREAFVEPVTRRNRVWQMDFSEFETAGQGVWNLGGIVDYAGKLALGCPISATKTARDAIAALEHARDRAADLLGRPLAEDCIDPDTGELVSLILVTDNGSCFRAADFARHLHARPEFRHVRTRVKSPETNGQIERFFRRSSTSTSTATRSQTAWTSKPTLAATSTPTTWFARTRRSPSPARSTPTSPTLTP
jgi:putative transposase